MARPELRVINPDPKIKAKVEQLAKEGDRTVPRQIELMLREWIEANKKKK